MNEKRKAELIVTYRDGLLKDTLPTSGYRDVWIRSKVAS